MSFISSFNLQTNSELDQASDVQPSVEPQPAPVPSQKENSPRTFYEILSNDKDIVLKPMEHITNSFNTLQTKMNELTSYWEGQYKQIWEQVSEALSITHTQELLV